MALGRTLIYALVLAFPGTSSGESKSTITRAPLRDFGKQHASPDDPLSHITASTELDTVQENLAQGIEFFLDISNNGSEIIELIHKTNSIHIYLWNRDGVRVDVPDANRGTNCGPRGQVDRSQRPRPFRIVEPVRSARRLPQVTTIPTDVEEFHVDLLPGHHLQIRLQIPEILAEPEKWWTDIEKRSGGQALLDLPPPDPPQIQPIPPGLYRLDVYFGLAVPGQEGWGASCHGLLVQLGPRRGGSRSTSGGKPESTVRRSQLMEGDRIKDPQNDPLSLITAFVELETKPDVSNGINFLVDILNPGSEPVELLASRSDNPIIIQLYNALGMRVDVPDPNWVYLQSLRIQEARKPEHAGGHIRRDVPFRLMESEGDQGLGRVKSLRDVQAGKVTLDPGEHFQLRGRIEEVLADPQLWWPLEPQKELPAHLPNVIPITQGMYFLKISVWLRTDVERSRLVSSNGLLVELSPT